MWPVTKDTQLLGGGGARKAMAAGAHLTAKPSSSAIKELQFVAFNFLNGETSPRCEYCQTRLRTNEDACW